jgi:hypothetical protein
MELTLRSWTHTHESRRRTIQKNDVTNAVAKNEAFDFLVDIVPREEIRACRLDCSSSPAIRGAKSTRTEFQTTAPSAVTYSLPSASPPSVNLDSSIFHHSTDSDKLSSGRPDFSLNHSNDLYDTSHYPNVHSLISRSLDCKYS